MKTFGPKEHEVTGDWRRLHNEELYDLYSSPNIIQVIEKKEMRGTYGTCGRQKKCVRFLAGTPDDTRQLVTPRLKCEDNIRLNL
jgi:hypothetical protein